MTSNPFFSVPVMLAQKRTVIRSLLLLPPEHFFPKADPILNF